MGSGIEIKHAVRAWKLPWPVYVASAWWFLDGAVRNAKARALAAVDGVHGARALEPRITTSASTARTCLALPMILLWLDTVGVTLSSVWGLLGFGGVAVSLGLKDLVADFISGLMMLTNPTFKVGDNIKAGAVVGTGGSPASTSRMTDASSAAVLSMAANMSTSLWRMTCA